MTRLTPPAVRAAQPQGATFIELFFDLVFVFAVTQVTTVLREQLDASGAVRAVVVFWLVWWAWTQFCWTLNAADTEHRGVELLTMAATAAAFLMAVTVPDAYAPAGWWFAAAYIVVRLLGIAGQFWVSADDTEWKTAVTTWASLSGAGLAVVALASVLAPGVRTAAFAVAIVLDLVASWRAGSGEWRLFPSHFAERHGLFVIIALGESLIAAGVAAGELARTATLLSVAVPAVVATCALWWTYFGWANDALEEAMHRTSASARGRFARDVYSFLHFPIIGGIIAFAAATEIAIREPSRHLAPTEAVALILGVVLFVGGVGLALRRAGAALPVVRLVVVLAMLATYPLLVTWAAPAGLTVVAVVVVAGAVVERAPRPVIHG